MEPVQAKHDAMNVPTLEKQVSFMRSGDGIQTEDSPLFESASSQVQPFFQKTAPNGRPAVRSPGDLRLHPALAGLGTIDVLQELNGAARLKSQAALEPILITPTGIVLAGFGSWRLALSRGWPHVHCIEYPLSDDEALRFMLGSGRTRGGWNAFVRICLALMLESSFQQQALENQRAGGKHKGSAKLPEAHRLDVRREIADAAGVGARNVSKVKAILGCAHPKLKEGLLSGTLSIHRAFQWSALSKSQQAAAFANYQWHRTTGKVIRRTLGAPKKEQPVILDALSVLRALQIQEEAQPGSVLVRMGCLQHTVVLLGRGELSGSPVSKEGTEPHEIPVPTEANSVPNTVVLGSSEV
jgi:hypothetical protein